MGSRCSAISSGPGVAPSPALPPDGERERVGNAPHVDRRVDSQRELFTHLVREGATFHTLPGRGSVIAFMQFLVGGA